MVEGSRPSPTSSGRSAALSRQIRLCGALLLLALASLACGPPPPPVQPDDVRTIQDFVSCLNGKLAGNPAVDISDTVQCLPQKCSITLTMSNISAQPACFSPGGCQLPRVLIDCPGPPRFMPSFLLCFSDEGSERVEIGQTVDEAGNMQMADIHIHPGAYTNIDPNSVLSVGDSKGCNTNGSTCHNSVGPQKYSSRIDPWDTDTNGNPDCIIASDGCDPDKKAITQPKECLPESGESRTVRPQSLEQVCQCIRDVADPGAPGYDPEDPLANEAFAYIGKLCDALESYQSTRGACAMAG